MVALGTECPELVRSFITNSRGGGTVNQAQMGLAYVYRVTYRIFHLGGGGGGANIHPLYETPGICYIHRYNCYKWRGRYYPNYYAA